MTFLLYVVFTNRKIRFPLTHLHKRGTEIERHRFEGVPNY